ncbi:tetratricopeptide repeat-containing diguanylate cyclase [Undibacterium fentianense]|uniref:diguanylate cyclase n=1 Tax=Undibacterium fentianense TaxID=2828728 RepID=A0A941IHE9_9BURK|nr:diguanylate cyclase [Undibacterium fentianense]MBR7800910.1 GGDEF domain-containing protein [Undibacterium fentianense]
MKRLHNMNAAASAGLVRIVADLKYYLLLQVFVLFGCLAFSQMSWADDKAIMAELDAIQTLSDKNNQAGLLRLLEFKKNLPAETKPEIRLEILAVLSGLYYDAGKAKLGEETVKELRDLAKQMKNKNALLMLEIFEAYDIFEKAGYAAGFAHLEKLGPVVAQSPSIEVKFRYCAALAGFYSSNLKFDDALKQYLEMLKLSEKLSRRQIQAKMSTWGSISGLYLQMKDPEKALAATTEALGVSSASAAPKSFIEISISRGVALSALKRNDEALKEYETALKIATEEKLPYSVALTLFNIADQYLIKKDYKRAESYAREAVAKSEALEDKWGVAGAKVNLGLALGYQGKVKQGADLVKESIAFFEKGHAKSDVETIMGELSHMYEAAGMYKEALDQVREQQELGSEIFQSDRAKAVAKLQEEFDSEQRKRQIEILAKDNALKDADIKNHRLQQMVALLASLVGILAGSFIYMLYRRSKKLNEQLQEVNMQLEFHAIRDALTGLHNRRSFISLMANRVNRVEVERREGSYRNPDCMVLMDIDHFKNINDTWGHAVGDAVLKEVANRLKTVVRDEDMVMRWGGEEFLIYSPKSNPEQITSLVDRVLRTIGEQTFAHGDLAISVTVTAGFISVPFSDVPEEFCDWERALQIADMALYLGKTHGRNRAYGLSRLLVSHELAIPTLTHDLAAAIKDNMVEMIEVIGPVQEHPTVLTSLSNTLS